MSQHATTMQPLSVSCQREQIPAGGMITVPMRKSDFSKVG
jgi:hypothetical protein